VQFETLLYVTDGPVATITLNRPDRLNTIVPPMPEEFETAVGAAVRDRAVRVIVLRGAGRSFCAGYDFGGGFHHWDEMLSTDGEWDPGKDFVATGALCADLIIASEDAQIGTPYSRMWGCYLSGMWLYRLGLAKAKEHALTGRPLSGREAADVELINRAVPFEALESTVQQLASELASVPASQLAAMKLIVNQAYENMGLHSTQTLGPILDGLMRNTPDAEAFISRASSEGVRAATNERDALFGDYSMAGPDRRPDPRHVIDP